MQAGANQRVCVYRSFRPDQHILNHGGPHCCCRNEHVLFTWCVSFDIVGYLLNRMTLGILMTHWIADSLTLWKSPLTDAHLYMAASYYGLLSKMNVYMAATIVGVVTLGFMALVLSFQDGEAENLMFDGASICMQPRFYDMFTPNILPQSYTESQPQSTCTLPFQNSPNSQTSYSHRRPRVFRPPYANRRSNSLRLISYVQSLSQVSSSSKLQNHGPMVKMMMVHWRIVSIRPREIGNAHLVRQKWRKSHPGGGA